MRILAAVIALLLLAPPAAAVEVIVPAPKAPRFARVTLQVGSPSRNKITNVVFDVPAGTVGNGTDVAGSRDVEVKARGKFTDVMVLTAGVAAPLTSSSGAIPFTQIRWESSDPGDIPAGRFDGTANQEIARAGCTGCTTIRLNAVLSFYYLNDQPAPAGTYSGRVTYTLTSP